MMKSPVLFDFETCSAADLPTVGGRNYAAHESTRVLIGVFLIDGVFHVWLPDQDVDLPCFNTLWPKQFGVERPLSITGFTLPEAVCKAIDEGREFVAHNCHEFDEHVWRAKLLPVPEHFGDTIHAARAAGLPAKLDDLGKRFFGIGKDAGQNIMAKMWKLEPVYTIYKSVGPEYHNKHQTPGNIALATRYCIGDVVILEKVYAETLGFGEPNVINVHRAINNRGVQLDTQLCRTLIQFSYRASEEAGLEIERITGGEIKKDDLRKVEKIKKWLAGKGVPMDSLRKQNVEKFLSDPDAFLEELEDHE